MNPEVKLRTQLDCLFKELELLQSEMDKRLDRHAQSFYFLVLLLAAVITGIGAILGSTTQPIRSIEFICVSLLFLPWLTTPLAAIFFDDEILRATTDCYVYEKLAPRIRNLAGEPQYSPLLRQTLRDRFEFLRTELCRVNHNPRLAADTRRSLFVIPFVAAFLGILILWFVIPEICVQPPKLCGSLGPPTLRQPWYIILCISATTITVPANVWLGCRLWEMWRRSKLVWERVCPRVRLIGTAPRHH